MGHGDNITKYTVFNKEGKKLVPYFVVREKKTQLLNIIWMWNVTSDGGKHGRN